MDGKSYTDSFGTFLESVQRNSQQPQQSPPATAGAPLKLLGTLAEHGAQPLQELMAQSGLSFTEFADSMKTMQDTGLLEISGTPGQEQVDITPRGRQLTHLVR